MIISNNNISKFNSKGMRSDLVSVQPENIQFNRQNSQMIKIINNTSTHLSNFFFCLYNTEKFSFLPDSFSLAPNEHKIITVTLKTKITKSVSKQFAYLKSAEINKRITLLINNFQSPDTKTKFSEEGMEDANTLSSREYKEIQTAAIEKVIQERQAYIAKLEMELANKSPNYKTEGSYEKSSRFRKEVEELQMKTTLLQNEKDDLLRENILLQEKFEEYRKLCDKDLRNYDKITLILDEKTNEVGKLQEQVQFLEEQGNQFLKKITEKEERIKELEFNLKKNQEQYKKDGDKKVNFLEQKLEEQKKSYQESLKNQQDKLRQLEQILQKSDSFRDQSVSFEKQLKKKQQELKKLMRTIEEDRVALKQFENERKKIIKLELMNESLNQKTNELTNRAKDLEKVNQNLREQIFVYKSKVAENDLSSDKMGQYLEIALESCRSQNQALKKTKRELQKSLDEFMGMNRQSHENVKVLNQQLSKYREEVAILQKIRENLERRNEESKQEHHIALMQLKSQNIELLQKVSSSQTSKRQETIKRLQFQIAQKSKQIEEIQSDYDDISKRFNEKDKEIDRLNEKVRKYKKQARKELKDINSTAIDELKRVHEQKKILTKKVIALENQLDHESNDKMTNKDHSKTKNRSRSKYEACTEKLEGRDRNQRSESRKVGIKDQRKEIEEIHSLADSNLQNVYSELGELRQLNNYIRNEEERFNRLFDLDQEKVEDSTIKCQERSIYRVIKFFKLLENKLKSFRCENDSSLSQVKQIQFMKGRLKELESIKDDKKNEAEINSSMNLSKTKEYCGELLEFIREEMKNQYKKLNETIRLNDEKHDILKKKIYEEYRVKIIQALNKKEKTSLPQIEATLERFIDGMSNLSHKQALLHKETRLKQAARKQNQHLRQSLQQLNALLQTKKGCCTRDPLKIIYSQNEAEWQESLKRQAQFLTLSAQNQRLKEEYGIASEDLTECKTEIKRLLKQLDDRSEELTKLKKNQIELQNNYQTEIQKQYELIEENKKKILEMNKLSRDTNKLAHREKEYNNLKQDLDRKKDIIKNLREKEKMLDELLEESNRSEEKEKRKFNEENRVLESMRDLKESNRELRNQNGRLKEKISKLEEDVDKKGAYLKNLKGDVEENRIRALRKDQQESQKLREQIRKLMDQLKKSKQDIDKLKKKKEKEIHELEGEIQSIKNQAIISEKSFQSIIRALVDTVRKLYSNLRLIIKKKLGKEIGDNQKLFDITVRASEIDASKVYDAFQEALQLLERAN